MTYFCLPKAEFWEIFDTNFEEIQDVCSEIQGLYNYGKIEINEVKEILIKFNSNPNEKPEITEGKVFLNSLKNGGKKEESSDNLVKNNSNSHKRKSLSKSRERSRKREKHSKHQSKKHKSHKKRSSSRSSSNCSSDSRDSSSEYSRKKTKKKEKKHKKTKRKRSNSSRLVRYSPIKLSSPKFDRKVVTITKNNKK